MLYILEDDLLREEEELAENIESPDQPVCDLEQLLTLYKVESIVNIWSQSLIVKFLANSEYQSRKRGEFLRDHWITRKISYCRVNWKQDTHRRNKNKMWSNNLPYIQICSWRKYINVQTNRRTKLSQHLLVRSQQWKHQNNVWNIFEVENEGTRAMLVTKYFWVTRSLSARWDANSEKHIWILSRLKFRNWFVRNKKWKYWPTKSGSVNRSKTRCL